MQASDVLSHASRSRFAFDRALGPLRQYLEREGVFNVNCNADGRIFVEERGRGKYEAPETMDELEREALVGILANETKTGPISRLSSRLAFDLPHGYDGRGQAFCEPVGPGWPLMLRNHASEILSDEQLVFDRHRRKTASETFLAPTCHEAIAEAVRRRWNIVFAGPQNAGKTTLMSWALGKVAILRPTARLVVMQDRDELKIAQRDHVKLFACVPQKRYEHDGSAVLYEYGFPDLLRDGLRTTADVYAFGELRDSLAALGLVMASNHGARGILTTVHANDALEALYRIETLLETAPGVNFTRGRREMIGRFVDLVVYLEYDEETRERWVGDVKAVRGVQDGNYVLTEVIA